MVKQKRPPADQITDEARASGQLTPAQLREQGFPWPGGSRLKEHAVTRGELVDLPATAAALYSHAADCHRQVEEAQAFKAKTGARSYSDFTDLHEENIAAVRECTAAAEGIEALLRALRGTDEAWRAARDLTFDEVFDELMRCVQIVEDSDREFGPPPCDPGPARAKLRALGRQAVPGLVSRIQALASELSLREALYALRDLGPVAAIEAGAPLEALLPRVRDKYLREQVATTLWAVDEGRARRLELHLSTDLREPILLQASRHGRDARAIAAHLREFLSRGGSANKIFGLRGDTIKATWQKVAESHPELVPLAAMRELLRNSDKLVRSNAIFVLGQVRTKDDMRAEMIKAAVSCGTSVAHSTLDHLAPHPDSEMLIHSLIAGADVEGLERLVRRRRCAGLSTDPTRLRPLLRETIALPKGRILDRSDQKVNAALRVVGDLGDRELLEAGLARLEYPDNDGGVYKALRRLLTIFGQSAIDQAADIQAGVKGRHAEQLGWVLEGPPRVTAHYTVDQGDELFGTGKIDTTVSCAFGVYGEVLLYDPSCAHAAFQLAWIDRAFGSPSGPGRIDWIRGLGFADSEFLVDLARPAAEPLGGHRFLWKPEPTLHDPTKLAEFGHRAERAGLYGLASTIYIAASNENSAHWDAFIRAVKEGGSHYRRVCAACGSQPLY